MSHTHTGPLRTKSNAFLLIHQDCEMEGRGKVKKLAKKQFSEKRLANLGWSR